MHVGPIAPRPAAWPRAAILVVAALLAGPGCAERIHGLIDCEIDEDCPSGYCDQTSHFCFSGQRECDLDTHCNPPLEICLQGQCRPGCVSAPCELGETCNPGSGRCRFLQSCTIDSNCAPPATVCLESFCEVGCGVTGCRQGYCDPYSGHCQGATECLHDGQCSPPSTVCEGGSCVAGCLSSGCEGGESCNPLTGRCQPTTGCTLDAQCSPPSTVCEGGSCMAGCLSSGCGSGQSCNPQTGRCEVATSCAGDGDCSPPATICVGSQCTPGCATTGCTSPATCNTATGRCESGGLLPDGADCTGNGSCLSGLCRHIEVNHGPPLGWVPFDVCTSECCTEGDCPAGAACLYHDGAKICIPDRIYPSGYSFTLSAGLGCSPSGPQFCRSGFCNPQTLTCARTCCESSECGGDLCSWYNDGSNLWELCRAQGSIGFGATGSPCSSEYDCQSFVCLGPAGSCASLCCSNIDCPGGYRCAQVLGQAGTNFSVTSACVAAAPGPKADGQSCVPGDAPSLECASGLCAGGTCRSPCCHDADCTGGQRCTTVLSGIDADNDGQSDWVRACLP